MHEERVGNIATVLKCAAGACCERQSPFQRQDEVPRIDRGVSIEAETGVGATGPSGRELPDWVGRALGVGAEQGVPKLLRSARSQLRCQQ